MSNKNNYQNNIQDSESSKIYLKKILSSRLISFKYVDFVENRD
jgi:hypothetical protein